MLLAIEQVHQTNHIHRDVKPANFRVHDGKVYITDFGTVRPFIEETTKEHIEPNPYDAFRGTIHFSSL